MNWTLCEGPGTSTVVLAANGEVHTHEEAQAFVHDPNLFVTVQLLEETPAVLSLGKLWEDHGHAHEWVSSQKPRLTKEEKTIVCKTDNFVPLVVPGLSTNPESVSSSTSSAQDSLRRGAEITSRKQVRPASSSSSVLVRAKWRSGVQESGAITRKPKAKNGVCAKRVGPWKELRQWPKCSARVVKWSPLGAPRKLCLWAGEEPEDHNRNHGTITGTLSWYKISPLDGFNPIRAKNKNRRRRRGVYESF